MGIYNLHSRWNLALYEREPSILNLFRRAPALAFEAGLSPAFRLALKVAPPTPVALTPMVGSPDAPFRVRRDYDFLAVAQFAEEMSGLTRAFPPDERLRENLDRKNVFTSFQERRQVADVEEPFAGGSAIVVHPDIGGTS